jgi:hypothetical protein
LSPLIFPYIVKSERQRESLKLLGFGCSLSVALLLAAYLVFHSSGAVIIRTAFGLPYQQAGWILPSYLLALIPMAIHCNVVNALLARGKLSAIAMLWVGLVGYYLVLKYLPNSIGSYIAWVAICQGALSIAGLVANWIAFRPRSQARLQPPLEPDITFGNGPGGIVERVSGYRATSQVQSNR